MHRRSSSFALTLVFFIALIEWSAYASGRLLVESLGHPHAVTYYTYLYWTETILILGALLYLQKAFRTMFNVRRTYYGFQAAGILMTDILPKLLFSALVLAISLIQWGYMGL